MAITKVIYQDSNDGLLQSLKENGESLVSIINTDLGVKSAASDVISRELLEEYRPQDKNHVLVHLVGMGNSDQFGYNRNGDWFGGDALEKRAHTFVTHGHMFKEHNNRDPKEAIGQIKYASYAKKMQRVEILCSLDRTKDEEGYEMMKKGSDTNFSMSCKVPNDRCSCCGNEARTVRYYCDCLKGHMGQWMPDFEKYAFAYNDEPTFFDLSRVKLPADRIARHLEYIFQDTEGGESMAKAASVAGNFMVPSAYAAMADGINLDSFDMSEQLVISKLADAEAYIADPANHGTFYTSKRANACYGSYPFSLLEKLSKEEMEAYTAVKPATLFYELAKRASILSFPAFCQYISGAENVAETALFKRAAIILPSMFGTMARMVTSMTPMTSMFQAGSECSCASDGKRNDLVQRFMDKATEKFSIENEPVQRRVVTIIMKGASVESAMESFDKCASANADESKANDLAQTYAQYQVRALCDIRDIQGNDSVPDNVYDLIAGANSVLVFDR